MNSSKDLSMKQFEFHQGLQIPDDIRKANCAGGPVSFKWDEELSSKFAFDEELNVRMAKAFNEANYRINITLVVCIFEWFVRRFEGVLDLTDANLRLEAAWVKLNSQMILWRN